MIKYLLFSLILLCLCGQSAYAQTSKDKKKENTSVEGDGDIKYPKQPLVNPDFDFKLKSTQKGKFILSFLKSQNKPVVIKIYDITGNLVLRETVSEDGFYSKEFDLSYYKPRFFVVEVGSSEYNKTKSIIAD